MGRPHIYPLKLSSVIGKDQVEVTGDSIIRNECRKEFEHRLRNRPPHEEWKQYTENINEIIDLLLHSDDIEESTAFTMEELTAAINHR